MWSQWNQAQSQMWSQGNQAQNQMWNHIVNKKNRGCFISITYPKFCNLISRLCKHLAFFLGSMDSEHHKIKIKM
jgi:hypothetical protein